MFRTEEAQVTSNVNNSSFCFALTDPSLARSTDNTFISDGCRFRTVDSYSIENCRGKKKWVQADIRTFSILLSLKDEERGDLT